jgi:hypothetical protein
LAKSAHRSPDGDLAGYVLDRTEEDPASFGASIVFYRDAQAETLFALANGATAEEDGWVSWNGFKSPDPDNVLNLPHVRLLSLEAADLVDEPAANPNGMFHTNPVGELAELADYALGLADVPPPQASALDVNPDRRRDFVDRYLANRRLQIVPMSDEETPPAERPATQPDPPPQDPAATAAPIPPAEDESPADPPPAHPPPAAPAANATGPNRPLAAYCAAFGDAAGARFFLDAVTFEAAQQTVIESLRAENAELAARAELAGKEHPAPLRLGTNRKTLREMTRIRRA